MSAHLSDDGPPIELSRRLLALFEAQAVRRGLEREEEERPVRESSESHRRSSRLLARLLEPPASVRRALRTGGCIKSRLCQNEFLATGRRLRLARVLLAFTDEYR
jgi:hypothetical protein